MIFIWLLFAFWPFGISVEFARNEEWKRDIRMRQQEVNESINCHEYLQRLQSCLPVKVLLVDSQILESVGKGNCEKLSGYMRRIKVATNSRKDILSIDQQLFEPIFFENDEKKDYLQFDTEPIRIIPKNFTKQIIGHLAVPRQPFRFRQFWKNSVFMKCLNLTMHRNLTKPRIKAEPSTEVLSELRDLLIAYDMFPMISEGTLLGWYRECTNIPHTNDMDVNVFVGEFNPKLFNEMMEGNTPFRIRRRLGRLENGLEFTVSPREGYKVYTDIFLMYEYKNETSKENYNWISGITRSGERIRMTTPLYGAVCALDLHGHIFWATCDPEKAIEHEFGEDWRKDLNTKVYYWDKTRNVIRMGRYSKSEMKEVYFS